jgi:hypothetical protein
MSRVWSRRGGDEDSFDSPSWEEDGVPFYGPNPYDDPLLDEPDVGEGSGDDDVAAVAREARMMAQMMGEPLDAEFDQALRHIEQGADPDDVFGEMDSLAEEAPPAADDET